MSKINSIAVVLLTALSLAGATHGATITNAARKVKGPEAVKIGNLVFEGGDGSSVEQAVIIRNAKNEEEGVDAESRWIRKVHPGWRKGNQALLNVKGRSYDQIEYETPAGKSRTIYFDITEFFGKF